MRRTVFRSSLATGMAAVLAATLTVTLAAQPAAADRERDRIVAGALILGAVGLAIAGARRSDRAANHAPGDHAPGVTRQRTGGQIVPLGDGRITRQLTVPDTVPSTGTITAPIHITPPRTLYVGPGGVAPGTRTDPLAGLGPVPVTGATGGLPVDPVKPQSTTQAGIRIEPLYGPDRVSGNGFVPDPVVTPWVETRVLPPLGQPQVVTAPRSAPLQTGGTGPLLPAQCLQTFDQNGENRTLYGPECLAATTTFAADLPVSCAVTLQTLGRFVSGYDPACLNAAGYSLGRG